MICRTVLLGLSCLLLAAAPSARAESDRWPELLKEFKSAWKDQFKGRWAIKVPPAPPPDHTEEERQEGESEEDYRERLKELRRNRQDELRKKRREARISSVAKGLEKRRKVLQILGTSADGRAVPELLRVHKKQLRYVEQLRDEWEERDEKWKKRQPAMEDALKRAPTNAKGQTLLPRGVIAFFEKEKPALDRLYRKVTLEERVAELVRKATAQVMNNIEGKERDTALKVLTKLVGKGLDAEEREFIRVLGYMRGDDVTEVLTKFARGIHPLVIAAALEALGRQNTPGAIEILTARLDDARWQIRVAAIDGLAFYRDAKVVEVLLDGLEKADGVTQRHYLAALARLFGHSPGTTSVAYRKYWTDKRADIEKAWAESPADGPVRQRRPAVMVKGKQGEGYSFYGIKSESKHVIFVVDVSGSMGPEHGGVNEDGKSRLDVLKQQLKQSINQLTAKESDERGVASFNIVTYDAMVSVYKPGKMVPATKKNKEKAIEWIDALRAEGATNIYDALEQAFQIIGTRKAKKQYAKGADTIFLMTDGKPNRGKVTDTELIRLEIGKLNRDRKFTIHTIGVGKDHEVEFLEKLAAENSGEYLAR